METISPNNLIREFKEMEARLEQELTHRKQLENDLLHSDARFRRIIEKNPDSILIVDTKGTILYANPSAEMLMDRKADDLKGSLFGFPLVENEYVEVEIVLPNSAIACGEMRIVKADWEKKEAFLVSLRDISERKLMEKQLAQVQKIESLGRMAAGIAHDFNNHLTIINSYAEICLSNLDDSNGLKENLEDILNAGHQSARLTKQLMAFSSKQKTTKRTLDVNRLVKNMAEMIDHLLGSSIKTQFIYSTDPALIAANYSQMEQVLMNLAINAKDAISATGCFIIEIVKRNNENGHYKNIPEIKSDKYIMLKISDTGSGMSPEVKEHIFEPFYTTKEKGKGTGLGLSTVYGIVKQNSGVIRLTSEPGNGTSFQIYFPQKQC